MYIEEDYRRVRQPQRRMNLSFREIEKEELHKLHDVNSIYPISDNKHVSPLVIVPKNNGNWRVLLEKHDRGAIK
jgi:hypothetical protein